MVQINWSGYTWNVRSGSGDPGPSNWSDSTDNVFVDSQGRLHLKITNRNGNWYCASIQSVDRVGYGTYINNVVSDPSIYPNNVTVGLFYWLANQYTDELDIEFSRWSNSNWKDASDTVWINNWSDNVASPRFDVIGNNTVHKMVWSQDKIYFEHPGFNWTFPGTYKPHTGGEWVINFWVYDPHDNGYQAPADGKEQELILSSFSYDTGTPIPKKYRCTGSPDYQCVEDSNGPYDSLEKCQNACKPPQQKKYRCSGSPDYQCIEDPNGPYNSLQECQNACKAPSTSRFTIHTVGKVGVLVQKNPRGDKTSDEACKSVCDILKNI